MERGLETPSSLCSQRCGMTGSGCAGRSGDQRELLFSVRRE